MVISQSRTSRSDLSFERSKIPPQNVEAELAVIGGLLIDPAALERVAEIIKSPADFYQTAHQLIYQACLEVSAQRLQVDLITVSGRLNDKKQLEGIGGVSRLANIVETTLDAVNISDYAKIVRDKAQRRAIIAFGREAIERAENEALLLPEVVESVEKSCFNVLTTGHCNTAESISLADAAQESFAETLKRAEGGAEPWFVSTGFLDLDSMLPGGLQRSDLYIVAARPAMGKTSFVLNIARNAAAMKTSCLIISLEMSRQKVTDRFLSAEAKVEYGKIRTGKMDQEEWVRYGEANARLTQLPGYIEIDDKSRLFSEVRSKARRFATREGPKVIIIDYLQLLEGTADSANNRVQEISRITRALKLLAMDLDVPVIALSQLSRAVESRTNKRPQLADLRDSGSIEQDADTVIMLYRDEYYNPESEVRGVAEVIVAKQRDGPVGTVKLLFETRFTQFLNLAYRS